VRDVVGRITQHGLDAKVMGISVGQVVGLMNERRSVAEVVADLASGCDDTIQRLTSREGL
jgi:hypothetical protein